MSEQAFSRDRRTFPRFTGADLKIGLRRRGRLGRVPGRVLDFNRFGVAVQIAQRLAEDEEVFVTLRHAEARVDNVVGVVHTCSAQEDGFRCGIQFRIQSKLQFDREQVEAALLSLERGFTGSAPSPDGPSTEASASH
ncbi:MAG: PilZ domain-containing protein [Gammaproteobacteria bacterium]|nr:PilZ domain-containing protein [Gammaproteobacteria bacterium]